MHYETTNMHTHKPMLISIFFFFRVNSGRQTIYILTLQK